MEQKKSVFKIEGPKPFLMMWHIHLGEYNCFHVVWLSMYTPSNQSMSCYIFILIYSKINLNVNKFFLAALFLAFYGHYVRFKKITTIHKTL